MLCLLHLPPPPPRLAFPFPPGEESGLLCSLASTWNWPIEALAGDWCLKEERGSGIFVLPPLSLLGSSDCVELISLKPQLLSCSYNSPLIPFTLSGLLLVPEHPSIP